MNGRIAALSLLMTGLCFGQVTVPEGTKIRVRLEHAVSSSTAEVGQSVELSVSEAVVVDGVTLIKDGARVTGTVTQAVGKRRMGRSGKLDFTIDRVSAADGQWIPLRYSPLKKSGESHTVRTGIITAGVAVAFWPAAPAVLLLQGKDITINKGMSFDVFTDSTHVIAGPAAAPARQRPVQVHSGQPPVEAPVIQQAAEVAAPKASPAFASITVTSPTGGADIEVDGQFVGNTPTTLRLPAGKHQVAVRNGALSWQRVVQVNAGSTVSLNAVLAPATVAAKAR